MDSLHTNFFLCSRHPARRRGGTTWRSLRPPLRTSVSRSVSSFSGHLDLRHGRSARPGALDHRKSVLAVQSVSCHVWRHRVLLAAGGTRDEAAMSAMCAPRCFPSHCVMACCGVRVDVVMAGSVAAAAAPPAPAAATRMRKFPISAGSSAVLRRTHRRVAVVIGYQPAQRAVAAAVNILRLLNVCAGAG